MGLLLTTPRILWQAGTLHFKKRLDVFPRPEPFVKLTLNDSVAHVKGEINPVEDGAREGGVGWLEEGAIEILAREKTIEILGRRVTELLDQEGRWIRVTLRSADAATEVIRIEPVSKKEPDKVEELVISFLTPVFYTDLLVSPSIHLAMEIGDKSEHRWNTSNDELFLQLFESSTSFCPPTGLSGFIYKLCRRLLRNQMMWGLSYSTLPSPHPIPLNISDHHPFYNQPTISLLYALALHFFIIRLGVRIFALTGAQFVRGRETWGEWSRWSDNSVKTEKIRMEVGKVEFGSVLRGELI